jgi:uroporphyrinogen-III synthase
MKKVAITRPKVFLPAAIEYVRSKGLEPVPVPMMEMVQRKDGALESFFGRLEKGEVDTVILTSQNGVGFVTVSSDDIEGFVNRLNEI